VEMELPNVDCVRADVLQLVGSKWEKSFDTVVMNPPFGTKHNAGMDMRFLEVALRLANSSVYSFLHSCSRKGDRIAGKPLDDCPARSKDKGIWGSCSPRT